MKTRGKLLLLLVLGEMKEMMTSKSLRSRALWKWLEMCVWNRNLCNLTLYYLFMHVCLCRSWTNQTQSEVKKRAHGCGTLWNNSQIGFSLQTCSNDFFFFSFPDLFTLQPAWKQQWSPLLTSAITRFFSSNLVNCFFFFPRRATAGMDNINELALRLKHGSPQKHA